MEIWQACLQHSSPLYIIYYSMAVLSEMFSFIASDHHVKLLTDGSKPSGRIHEIVHLRNPYYMCPQLISNS